MNTWVEAGGPVQEQAIHHPQETEGWGHGFIHGADRFGITIEVILGFAAVGVCFFIWLKFHKTVENWIRRVAQEKRFRR